MSALSLESYVREVARTMRAVETVRAEVGRDTAARPRLSPLRFAHDHAVLRTGDGQLLRYGDVARDYQDALLADEASRIIVAKSRQIGISQTVAFIAAAEALNGGTALWISYSGEQASEALDYVYTALSAYPDHPGYAVENQQSLQLRSGGRVVTRGATEKAGRGVAASLVILDEMAWQFYADRIYTAILPTLATTNGRLIVLSSANGRANLFYTLWERLAGTLAQVRGSRRWARATAAGWSCYFLPWQAHPAWGADPDWAERKRRDDNMTDEAFAQEYDVDFLVSGAAVFDPDEIAALWRGAFAPAEPGHRYVSAFDIGRKRDPFVGFTFDVSTAPFRVVAYQRQLRLPYPDQAGAIEATAAAYPGEVWVESNGVGDPLIGFLRSPVREFVTSALTKRNAVDALKLLVQRRELISPRIPEWERELTLYRRADEQLQQDTVMASAIAALAAGRPVRRLMAW